jgi:abequosyltransferase
MPIDSPLLTIGIPTYNRAEYLDGLLATIQEQTQGESRVELLVSDNASADGTDSVVETYQARGLAIRYIRNNTNIGPDRNILQCYQEAAGKYVWIFSDDDILAPGTLKRVLNALLLEVYDLVCIRAYFFSGEYVRHKIFSRTADLDLSKPEDLARHFHVFFTFISGVIVYKERISSMPHRPFESLLDTNLAQLGPFYTALNHHRRSLLIRDPLIAARGNSNVGYALYRVFGPSLARITGEWLQKKSVQRAITNGTIQTFFPFFILLTRLSHTSSVTEDPHVVLSACYARNFRYWIFDYPIYVLPLPFARIWLFIVKAINKVDSLLGGPLVRS